jgi:hypothetical protein
MAGRYTLNHPPSILPTVHIDGGGARSSFTWIDFVMSRDFDLVFESHILTVIHFIPYLNKIEA